MAKRTFTPVDWLFLVLLLNADLSLWLLPIRQLSRWVPFALIALLFTYGVAKTVPQIVRDLRETVHPPPSQGQSARTDPTDQETAPSS